MVWGVTMAALGVLLASWGTTRSDSVVYRLLVARSRILWGEQVHRFHQAAGAILVVLGALSVFGVIW
mgnify:CR=1 FL=1